MGGFRLQRSRDAVAGGVCAGVAEHVGVDPAVVRILTVLLCFMTLGAGVVLYFVLWAVLPQQPERVGPVDVAPRDVTSETYGILDAPMACRGGGLRNARPEDRVSYGGVAHEPPVPPLAARAAAEHIAASLASEGSLARSSEDIMAAQAGIARMASDEPVQPVARRSLLSRIPRSAKMIILWVCFSMAFVGMLRLLGFVFHDVIWWRLWPLLFSLAGIAVMAVPGQRTLRMAHAVTGWCLLVVGAVMLPLSLGLVRWASLVPWLTELWPLLLLAAACLTVGWTRRSWPWTLVAGVLFTLFAIGGLLLFAEPGGVSSVTLDMPFGRDIVFYYPF